MTDRERGRARFAIKTHCDVNFSVRSSFAEQTRRALFVRGKKFSYQREDGFFV